MFENLQIVAINLGGKRALHATDGLFHIVFNGLGETPNDAGNLVQFALHGRDQFFFIFVEDRPPLLLRLQVHKIFGVKEAGVIRPVVWPPHLTCALRNLGEGTKYDSRLVRNPDAFIWASAGRKRAANPECAFIQVGQEFGTNDAAESQVIREGHQKQAHTGGDHPASNRPAERHVVSFAHERHDWVMPFLRPLRKREACQHRCDQDREQQRPEQREGNGPSHGVKEPAFDPLQRKDRQESGYGDDDGIEHRALHFMRRKTDSFGGCLDPVGVA